MTQQIINTGVADKGNGDPIRTAFTKVNANFTELFNHVSSGVVVDTAPPEAPGEGDLWWDPESGRMYVSYGANWVDASPVDGAGINSTNELVNGIHTVSLGSDGNLSVPDRITFSDDTWQSTAFIGHAYSLRNNPTGSLYVTLDDSGTINTPLLLPVTFTAVLDSAHKTGTPLTLTGTPWEFTVQFQVNPNGTVETMMNSIFPNLVNPGYTTADQFSFTEADHGIPGYTFELELDNLLLAGPAGWTASPVVSIPPEYPSTIKSLGAIKLTANEENLVFGTDGSLTFSDDTVQSTAWTGSVSSLVNSTKTVSLGSDGTLTLPAQAATLQTVDQIFTAKIYRATDSTNATAIQEAKDNWFGAELTFADIRDQDAQIIAPATRPWAGMPSYEAYPLIMEYNQDPPGGVLPPPGSIAPAANTATNAYIGYKELVSNIDIVSGDKVFSFENTGNLQVPGVVTSNDLLTLISSGTATLNSASVVADGDSGNVFVKTLDGNAGTEKTWTFGTTGSLTLPDNSVIASYKPVTVIAATTTTQTISDNASAAFIQFVDTVDTADAFSTGVFTVPYTGYYQVNMSVYFSSAVALTSTSFLLIDTNLDFTKQVRIFDGNWSGSYLHYSTVISASANDAVRIAIRQVSGGDIDILSGSRLTIHRVSIS
jgi:hypothetical protein